MSCSRGLSNRRPRRHSFDGLKGTIIDASVIIRCRLNPLYVCCTIECHRFDAFIPCGVQLQLLQLSFNLSCTISLVDEDSVRGAKRRVSHDMVQAKLT